MNFHGVPLYNPFDNLLRLSMAYMKKNGAPPSRVRLPLDEAKLLAACPHAGLNGGGVDHLLKHGIAGMNVEIGDDPDAVIMLLK
jgi:hypothetical protein